MNTKVENKLTYDLTYKDVIEILKMVEIPSMVNLELELEGLKLNVVFRESVTRDGDKSPIHKLPASIKPQDTADAAANSAVSSSGTALRDEPKQEPLTITSKQEQMDRVSVRAPLAGTFYRAPAPGAPPFVEVGQTVRMGDNMGLVEVMKLFTPVSSPCSGIVREICANDQQLVNCDQVLVIIEPNAQ